MKILVKGTPGSPIRDIEFGIENTDFNFRITSEWSFFSPYIFTAEDNLGNTYTSSSSGFFPRKKFLKRGSDVVCEVLGNSIMIGDQRLTMNRRDDYFLDGELVGSYTGEVNRSEELVTFGYIEINDDRLLFGVIYLELLSIYSPLQYYIAV